MNTKYLLYAALGVGAILLLTTDKGKQLRGDLADGAMDNAKKWKDALGKISSNTTDKLAELREMLSDEIDGLSDDARKRMETILDGTTKAAGKVKKNVASQMS